jgi:hypothetical protein
MTVSPVAQSKCFIPGARVPNVPAGMAVPFAASNLMTDEALERCLRSFTGQEAWKNIPDRDRQYYATNSRALMVITDAMGADWSDRHPGRSDKACDYFKPDRNDAEALLRFAARTSEFAGQIHNLKGVEGFDQRIKRAGRSHHPAHFDC